MLGHERLNVFFGNAAAKSGAGNLGQVNIVVLGDTANQRARAYAVRLAGLGIFRDCSLLSPLQTFFFVGREIGGNRFFGLRRFPAGRFGRFGWRGLAAIASGSRFRRLGRGWRGRGSSGSIAFRGNGSHYGVDLHRGSGLHFNVLQGAGGGCGNLGVNLVGRDFKQWLVALNLLTWLLQPFGNRSFKDRFPHLGHDYICRHNFLSRYRAATWRCRKPLIISRRNGG